MPPILYIKNALKEAEDGLGDGTAYATGTSAIVDQTNKTFTLIGGVFIQDILPNVDDMFNGQLLYFPETGNRYHIVDWVTATSKFTVWETPSTLDTGACEVRRTVVDGDALAGNPTLYLSDGLRGGKWKSGITSPTLTISLPNLIEQNAGFESGTLVGWKVISGAPTVNATAPILGGFDLSLSATERIWAILRGPIKKTTYRVAFKAKSSAWVSESLNVRFLTFTINLAIASTISNVSSGSILAGGLWRPSLTTVSTWHTADFTINTEQEDGGYLTFDNQGAASGVSIDEVYIFEKLNFNTIMPFDEDSSSGFNIASLEGSYVDPSRTGFVSGTDSTVMASDSGGTTHPTGQPIGYTGAIFPIYQIKLTTWKTAKELILCEKWTLPFSEEMPTVPLLKKRSQSVFKTRSGSEFRTTHFKQSLRKGTFKAFAVADIAKYEDIWVPKHFDIDAPFVVVWETGQQALLMVNTKDEAGLNYGSVLPDWAFSFKEVL